MPFELFDGSVFESRLVYRIGRVRGDDITAFLQFQRPLQAIYLDFAADALGSLPPFQFDCLQAMLLVDVFGHAQPCVLDVHLHQDFTVALVISAIGLDTAVHIGGFDDVAPGVSLQSRVYTADVFAADQRHAADSRADRKMLPVFTSYLGGAQSPGEYGCLHFNLDVPPVLRLGIDRRKRSCIRIAFNSLGHASGPEGVAMDIQVRVVDWIVFIATGGDVTERSGVNQFPTAEGCLKNFAVAGAAVDTPGTDTAHR